MAPLYSGGRSYTMILCFPCGSSVLKALLQQQSSVRACETPCETPVKPIPGGACLMSSEKVWPQKPITSSPICVFRLRCTSPRTLPSKAMFECGLIAATGFPLISGTKSWVWKGCRISGTHEVPIVHMESHAASPSKQPRRIVNCEAERVITASPCSPGPGLR